MMMVAASSECSKTGEVLQETSLGSRDFIGLSSSEKK
jgi:hypothetical protein